MALPELTRKLIEKTLHEFCDSRIPPHIRPKLRLKFSFRGSSVTLFEVRPVWNNPSAFTESNVAQFRFDPDRKIWTLYCRDRYARWHKYDRKRPSRVFDRLLEELDKDPTGIFWG